MLGKIHNQQPANYIYKPLFALVLLSAELYNMPPELRKSVSTIPITEIQPEVFHHILYHLYGGKISDGSLRQVPRRSWMLATYMVSLA